MAKIIRSATNDDGSLPACLHAVRTWHDGSPLASPLIQAERLFLALDFDGTLTPIVSHAAEAILPVEAGSLLARLAASDRVTVSILSGRALEDLQSRVGLRHIIYAGNHGLEIAGPDWYHVEPEANQRRKQLEELAVRLDKELRAFPGAWVENKGLTLCVHYRQAEKTHWPDIAEAVRRVARGTEDWLRVESGKRTWDLRPSRKFHKGTAATYIRQRLNLEKAFSVSIGDDTTDEDLFEALGDGLTIRVGFSDDTRACCCLASPAEVCEFLGWLARIRGLA
ncbi:MAG: trehalose-phosphatase [Gemmatales bacterium]|nr:trehalose-phosphatase [Gemmatales bacterium]MDW8385395.1 trehalose-phosphatase [Gemmatales bacterium]